MLGLLLQGGFKIVDLPEKAEIIIINTCSFVEDATNEAIETIYSLARQKDQGACQYLIVCDGFAFHALPGRDRGRIGDDLLKRASLLDSGRFFVWSITWKDLDEFEKRSFRKDVLRLKTVGFSTRLSTPLSWMPLKGVIGTMWHRF